jgi:hypothetical protein
MAVHYTKLDVVARFEADLLGAALDKQGELDFALGYPAKAILEAHGLRVQVEYAAYGKDEVAYAVQAYLDANLPGLHLLLDTNKFYESVARPGMPIWEVPPGKAGFSYALRIGSVAKSEPLKDDMDVAGRPFEVVWYLSVDVEN